MLNHGLLAYWWSIFEHTKILGYRTDIFRNIEDSYALKNLNLNSKDIYLDIGSGYSIIPSLVCKLFKCKTVATDMETSLMSVQKRYKKTLGLPESDYIIDQQDATHLTYPDAVFTKVSLISTVEHIPQNGDILAMDEIVRVLRPKGRAVVTVPCSRVYIEQPKTFYYDGFERRYDSQSIKTRLVRSSLRVVDEVYMCSPGEDFVKKIRSAFHPIVGNQNITDVWYKNGWHDKYSDISILLSLALIRLTTEPDDSVFGACLTLEKV